MKQIALGLVLLGSLAGCSSASDGTIPYETVEIDGVTREYLVHVPESVADDDSVPVVFMLHGTGGTGRKFYNNSGWREKADEEGFIAVFPSALRYCFWDDDDYDGEVEESEYKITSKWNDGKFDDESRILCDSEMQAAAEESGKSPPDQTELQDDAAFFDEMLDDLRRNYPADMDRVYVSGFSNGAQMVFSLIGTHSDVFAAFAASSALGFEEDVIDSPRPFVLTMGSKDPKVLAVTGVYEDPADDLAELPLDESLLDDVLPAGGFTGILTAMQLESDYAYELDSVSGVNVGKFNYASTANGGDQIFQFWMIDELGHSYPNGTNNDIVMADELWDFFSQYSF